MRGTSEERMIDVVEDFVCPQQTEAYRTAFQKWRRNEKNRFSFRFTRHPKEARFSESMPVAAETPSKAEQSVLYRLGYLFGCILILYLVVENVLDKVVVFCLNAMGMRIGMLFWGLDLYGDEQNVFLVVLLINMLKYLLPVLLLQKTLRMPFRVSMPARISQPKELLLGVVLTMMLSVGCGLFSVSNSDELEKYKLICNAVSVDDNKMILYTVFTVFIMPILIELLLHGAMFQVMRQFGDTFAIAAVTFLAAILMHRVQDVLRIAIMTMTFSYFVIRTGSFWTAVILHIVHEIYMFTLFYIETFESVFTLQWWIMMLLPCVVGILTGAYLLFHESDAARAESKNKTFLSFPDKCLAFISSVPMLGLIITSVVMLVVSTMISM